MFDRTGLTIDLSPVICCHGLAGKAFDLYQFSLGRQVFASLASALALWRVPKQEVRRSVRSYSISVTMALLIATAYLVYWGVIDVRTWS